MKYAEIDARRVSWSTKKRLGDESQQVRDRFVDKKSSSEKGKEFLQALYPFVVICLGKGKEKWVETRRGIVESGWNFGGWNTRAH
jgi:hypothetical protein